MLQSIEYENTFPKTGRTLKESIDFQKGFGTITGPNEAGKSFCIEMIRWAMFGTEALRGKAEDYVKAKVTLNLIIRGDSYTITRTKDRAALSRGDELIVSGTKPVNTRIVQLLGFGLKVFDVACVAGQGDLEKLGTMRPTERRQMVDSVIGLGVIDDLTKLAGDEASSADRSAAAMKEVLVAPIKPAELEDYTDPKVLADQITVKQQAHDEAIRLQAVKAPGPVPTELTVEQLEAEKVKIKLDQELKTLPLAPTKTEEELCLIEQHLDANDQARLWRGVKEPAHSVDAVMAMTAAHEQNEKITNRQEVSRQLATLEAHLTTCPACNHQWTHDETSRQALRDKLADMPDLGPVQKVALSKAQIQNVIDQWEIYNSQDAEPTIVPAELTRTQVAEQRHRIESLPRRKELETQLEGWTATVQNPDRLIAELAQHAKVAEAYADAQKVLPPFQKEAEGLKELWDLQRRCFNYDTDIDRYLAACEPYAEKLTLIQTTEVEAQGWRKAKDALVDLRLKVKQHLVPSLNKVASHYLVRMSGGSRQQVEVDEDFEILIDGQPLNTLSGSGKHIANLALRFGLGQVLTNNVFSLFIGDEIDAYMDKSRAGNTAEVLSSLQEQVSQVLLVTHKNPEADYYITVGAQT